MRPTERQPLDTGSSESPSRGRLIREWIIFALCLGVGGHLALAVVLHAPERWPWAQAGLYGLLAGIAVYASAQLLRVCWWAFRGRTRGDSIEA
jgi:hypothetical protein